MSPKLELESAIMDAKGQAAVMSVLREALLTHDGQQWDRIGIAPIKGSAIAVFSDDEWRAVDHALLNLLVAVEAVDKAFYAASEARAL